MNCNPFAIHNSTITFNLFCFQNVLSYIFNIQSIVNSFFNLSISQERLVYETSITIISAKNFSRSIVVQYKLRNHKRIFKDHKSTNIYYWLNEA